MAFNFIKKVFSFGKTKDDAPAPEIGPQAEPPIEPATEAVPNSAGRTRCRTGWICARTGSSCSRQTGTVLSP
jgi:hypothetical protein